MSRYNKRNEYTTQVEINGSAYYKLESLAKIKKLNKKDMLNKIICEYYEEKYR